MIRVNLENAIFTETLNRTKQSSQKQTVKVALCFVVQFGSRWISKNRDLQSALMEAAVFPTEQLGVYVTLQGKSTVQILAQLLHGVFCFTRQRSLV